MQKTESTTRTIQPNVLYRLDEFHEISGLGRHALRACRRAGLQTLRVGNRRFVDGSHAIEFFRQYGRGR